MHREAVDSLLSDALNSRLSRRHVLRRGTVLGLSTIAFGSLLSACGGDDDEDEEDGAAPTQAPGVSATATLPAPGASATATPPAQGVSATATQPAQPAETSTPAAPPAATGETRPQEEATEEEAILNFGAIQEPVTLDPHLSTSVSDTMLFNVYDKLVDSDVDDGEVIPELATSWEISSDGLTVTFSLQEGVLFHDGTPFNAEAARINFERCIALQSYIPEAFTAISSVDVVDDVTLDVTLTSILAPWIAMLTKNPKMISPAAIEEHTEGDDYAKTWLTDNTAGCGAYTHVRWDRGSNLRWEAFPDYWRGWEGKHVTTVNNRIILEPGTQRLQVEQGDLDVQMLYTQDSLTALRENPDLNIMSADQPNHLYIRLNNYDGPTSDIRVRQAISYGFNYDEYASLLNIDPPPPRADMPIPVQLFGAGYEAVEIPYFTYDPEMAQSLLDEAGFGDGFEMNIFTDPSTPQKPLLAEYFQATMAQFNVDVSITVEPFANILARGTDQELQKNFDTAIHAWILYTPPVYPEPSSFLLRMYNPYPNSVRNLLGYVSEEVQRLTEEGIRQTDPAAATELYWQANLQIVEDCPDLILDRSTQFEILRAWVKGHRPHAMEPWRWTYWRVWKDME